MKRDEQREPGSRRGNRGENELVAGESEREREGEGKGSGREDKGEGGVC